MPALSKAQSRALNAKFGHAWVKRHHFDNPTSGLPEHKADPRKALRKKRRRKKGK
jgi:hypothetical protein